MSAQSMKALASANEVRLARAELRRDVFAGHVKASDVLMDPEAWPVASMPIYKLLTAQHRWGRSRTLRLMRDCGIPETKRIGEATERQRLLLVSYMP